MTALSAREPSLPIRMKKILIHVSNLRPVKRVDEVLQIFKNVERKVKSKLIIIGEGPDMEKSKSVSGRKSRSYFQNPPFRKGERSI